jgi:hypothetical protein
MADKTNEGVVIYIATYASLDDAKTDYAAVKQLHSAGVIGTYDAAVISKDAAGKVRSQPSTGHGLAWRWGRWSACSSRRTLCGKLRLVQAREP